MARLYPTPSVSFSPENCIRCDHPLNFKSFLSCVLKRGNHLFSRRMPTLWRISENNVCFDRSEANPAKYRVYRIRRGVSPLHGFVERRSRYLEYETRRLIIALTFGNLYRGGNHLWITIGSFLLIVRVR